MGVSLYFKAKRATELTDRERAQLAEVIERFSGEPNFESYWKIGHPCSLRGKSFDQIFGTTDEGLFEGALKLPTEVKPGLVAMQTWCRFLSQAREVVADAEWSVRFEHVELPWDGQQYDPFAASN